MFSRCSQDIFRIFSWCSRDVLRLFSWYLRLLWWVWRAWWSRGSGGSCEFGGSFGFCGYFGFSGSSGSSGFCGPGGFCESGGSGLAGGPGGSCGSGGPSWHKGLSYSWKQTYKLWHHFVVFTIFSWSVLNFGPFCKWFERKLEKLCPRWEEKLREEICSDSIEKYECWKALIGNYECLKIQLKSISVRMLREGCRKTKT